MTANAFALTYTELLRHIGREINASRNTADWSSATSQDAADIVTSGLRQVYWPPVLPGEATPHEWSWMQPRMGELAIYPRYVTGTVSAAAGVVTLVGGTWPAWAADAQFWLEGERYEVATRDSDYQITLTNTGVTTYAGLSFELIIREYKLPDIFGGLVRDQAFVLRRDTQQPLGCYSPRVVSEAMVGRYDVDNVITGAPELVAFSPSAATTKDTRWYARFWPLPDQEYRLEYRYQVVPPIMNGTTVTHHYGGPQISNLVILSCLDKAMRLLYSSDEYYERFMAELLACVRRDRATNSRETLGYGVFSDGITHGYYDIDTRRELRRSQTTLGNINL